MVKQGPTISAEPLMASVAVSQPVAIGVGGLGFDAGNFPLPPPGVNRSRFKDGGDNTQLIRDKLGSRSALIHDEAYSG